jgi:hypothetical protein
MGGKTMRPGDGHNRRWGFEHRRYELPMHGSDDEERRVLTPAEKERRDQEVAQACVLVWQDDADRLVTPAWGQRPVGRARITSIEAPGPIAPSKAIAPAAVAIEAYGLWDSRTMD